MHLILRGALCAAVLSFSACIGAVSEQPVDSEPQALFGIKEPVCPTASSKISLNPFVWRTQRYVGHAVWSSDGTLVAGVETAYEEKKSWDPLNGTTEKRRNCHRAFVQKLDGSGKRYLGADAPGQAGTLFFMRQGRDAGAYALLQVFGDKGVDYERIAMDGKRTRIAHDDGRRLNLVPSPDGQTIAQVTLSSCDTPEGPYIDVLAEVRMLTNQGVLQGSAQSITAACDSVGFTFRPDGALVLTDGVRAHAFDTRGNAPTLTTLPRCVNPPTTSSWVDAQGRVLDFVDGKIGVTEQNPALAFGCQ